MTTTIEPNPLILKGQQSISDTDIIRMGIIGEPGTGKTVTAATFPRPVFLNFDNSLYHLKTLDFIDWKNIIEIPFYKPEFVYKTLGCQPFKGLVTNYKEAIPLWISTEGRKLDSSYTLVFDSWTRLQDFFEDTQEVDKVYNKEGKEDNFYFWGELKDWNRKVLTSITKLSCNSVVIFHEQKSRDEKGNLTEKIKPYQDGSFKDKIKGYFPYFFRQTVVADKDKVGQNKYIWQTKSNAMFDTKNANNALPMYVKADYRSLLAPNLPESIPTQVKTQ